MDKYFELYKPGEWAAQPEMDGGVWADCLIWLGGGSGVGGWLPVG